MPCSIFRVVRLLSELLESLFYFFFMFSPIHFHLDPFIFGELTLGIVSDIVSKQLVVIG